MAEPRSLFYYDRSPSAWLERTAGLSPLARAAYADLEGMAWTAPKRGAQPCSVPDDDVQLARMARMELREFRKVAAEVRGLFMYRDGVLVDEVLLKTWRDAQGRYTRRVVAGDKGNEAQGKGTHSKRNASRNANALGTQLEVELEAVPPVPTGTGVEQPAPGGAPAPEGARFAGAVAGQGRLTGAAPLRTLSAPSIADQQAERDDRERRYFALLTAKADAWMATHPIEARAIDFEGRTLLELPLGDLSPGQARVLRDAVLEHVRNSNDWPTTEEWDGSATLTRPLTGATADA